MSIKNYHLTPGTCKECCLYSECSKNKEDIKHFILSKGLLCENGMCLEVATHDQTPINKTS